jgi:membrane protein implicated in regulation of membrane protease activity
LVVRSIVTACPLPVLVPVPAVVVPAVVVPVVVLAEVPVPVVLLAVVPVTVFVPVVVLVAALVPVPVVVLAVVVLAVVVLVPFTPLMLKSDATTDSGTGLQAVRSAKPVQTNAAYKTA